jgi:hypothetical protein
MANSSKTDEIVLEQPEEEEEEMLEYDGFADVNEFAG